MSLNTVELRWDLTDLIQAGVSATLSITPTAQLSDSTDHILIPPVARTYTFTGGTGQLAGIVANDNSSLLPANSGYLISVTSATGHIIVPQFQTQLLFSNGATQWLDALAVVPSVTTSYQYLPLPSLTPASGQVPVATGTGEASAWSYLSGLTPSGDTSGTTDTASIQGLLNLAGYAPLGLGTFWCKPLTTSTGNRIRGGGYGTVLKMIASGPNDNLLKSVSVTDVHISDLVLDGNKGNQSVNSFGLYFGSCQDCSVTRVVTRNWNGDGTQLYNCDRVSLESCWSTGNAYHGFEVEQSRSCSLRACFGYSNTLHGAIITPGEVAGTGSQGNMITGGAYSSNGEFGICVNSDNGGAGSWLSEGNLISACSVTGNTQYGVMLYQEDKTTVEGCYIEGNGFFGVFCFESSYNRIVNNFLHNNSQAGNGSYAEVYLQGASSGHASIHNVVSGNTILIDGTTKASYAIAEDNSGDGPNIIFGNDVPDAGTSGTFNIQNSGTQLGPVDTSTTQTVNGAKTFGSTVTGNQGFAVAPNATLTGNMGMDAPFGTAAVRLVNLNSGGNFQFVTPNGTSQFWAGGNEVADAVAQGLRCNAGYGFRTVEGSNCKQGTATLNGTTAVVVSNTSVTANSRIFLTINTPGGTPASPYVSARTPGTSFSIKSTGASDSSTVAYEIFEPG